MYDTLLTIYLSTLCISVSYLPNQTTTCLIHTMHTFMCAQYIYTHARNEAFLYYILLCQHTHKAPAKSVLMYLYGSYSQDTLTASRLHIALKLFTE